MMIEAAPPLPRRTLRFPPSQPRAGVVVRRARLLFAVLVTPVVLFAGWLLGTPGMAFRLRCVALAWRALRAGDRRHAFELAFNPMDSFRYFELAFVAEQTRVQTVARREQRARIVDALRDGAHALSLPVAIDDVQAGRLIDDGSADRLDAVLCAVQAAWAARQCAAGHPRYGLPADIDPLEGWIVGVPKSAAPA